MTMNSPTPLDESPVLLNIPAAARLTGVSPYRVRAAVDAGELTAMNIAVGTQVRHLRLSRAEVLAWAARLRNRSSHA